MVDALGEDGCKPERAFKILSGRIGIRYDRIRDLYYDTKRSLINEPFTVIPKNINEGDPVLYEFLFIKPGVRIGSEEAKIIKAQMG